MADKTIRIGIVGAGGIVRQRHVPGLRKVAGVELAAVCNSTPESTASAAQEYAIPRQFNDWHELVQWDGIDAVVVGTPPYQHREISCAALAAGKHVFCQARMAMDYADARQMYACAQATDRTSMLCPPPHYMYGDRVVQRLLREGFVGKPLNVVVRAYGAPYLDPNAPLHWRQIGRISGINTLDVGMMIEVTQRWLGYAKTVVAQTQTVYPERTTEGGGRGKVDRPDALSAIATLENGALATYLWSGVARNAGTNFIEIYGTDGTLRYEVASAVDLGHLYGATGADRELREIPIPDDEARPWAAEADFIQAIREGRSGSPSFHDGLKYMEMTEAIFRSAEQGRVIDLAQEFGNE
ncbi:MAG TPA: Gfo/Idh/MocA family oxidoreductase [Thermomicrobiales bacterium]|nr:Gfo/Idh/MocA family oxidoreductase [Thermomicrobiales bacterium]